MISESIKEKKIYKDIGSKIKIGRKSSRKKINTISKKLNLSSEYLSWIEEGEIHNFPNYTPVDGFIKSYAKFLNIDISDEFKDLESLGTRKVEQASKFFPEKLPNDILVFALASLILIFILIIFF